MWQTSYDHVSGLWDLCVFLFPSQQPCNDSLTTHVVLTCVNVKWLS